MDRWRRSAGSEPGGGIDASEDRDVLEAYFATRWRIDHPGGPAEVSLAGGGADALPLPCAVITAYNPRSTLLSPAENRSRDLTLGRRLRTLGWTACRSLASGVGEDAALWDEPGFAVFHARAGPVIDLAGAFGQNAVLWIGDDAGPSILVTRDGFCGRPAGTHLRPDPVDPR